MSKFKELFLVESSEDKEEVKQIWKNVCREMDKITNLVSKGSKYRNKLEQARRDLDKAATDLEKILDSKD